MPAGESPTGSQTMFESTFRIRPAGDACRSRQWPDPNGILAEQELMAAK